MQCHFTWELDLSLATVPQLRRHLDDIHPQEGSPWLGHVHNLLGFISFRVGANQDALERFQAAAEAFRGAAGEDPCLVVTYGNLAWLHHYLGQGVEGKRYLSKVEVLMETHPPPSQDELHPEVYAEKAWTLMSISVHDQRVGLYFEEAITRRPHVVAWNSSYTIWLIKSSGMELGEELLEVLRRAKERDPDNSYLAVCYLNQRAQRGEDVAEEARTLAARIMASPVGWYSGIKTLLWIFTQHISALEAMNMAEQLLQRYPQQHYAKNCAAQCYRWSLSPRRLQQEALQEVRQRAVELHQDLVQRYPDVSANTKLHLAGIYAGLDLRRAEQEYRDLLANPDAEMRQKIYHKYAKFLFHQKGNSCQSARYHMEVLKIGKETSYRTQSYDILVSVRRKQLFPQLGLEEFLSRIPPPENQAGPQGHDGV